MLAKASASEILDKTGSPFSSRSLTNKNASSILLEVDISTIVVSE
jgi:hypothetical protein